MKITVISGSHRNNSQSQKVAHFVRKVLTENINCQADIFDLADNPLPLWDQGVWDGDEKWSAILPPIREQMKTSDAYVVISPEWHGQVPAGLKNFFLLMSKNELGHKPALIVTVSSSDGGAYPVAELRMSSYKNNRLCYIPEQVILRNVEKILNPDESQNDVDANEYFSERIEWTLKILEQYAISLKAVRDSGVTDTEKFNNGM